MSPTLELWGAIVARLKTSVTALGGRVYDSVPAAATFPYLSLGGTWEVQADAECIGAREIGIRLDVWSRAVGSAEARAIADVVVRDLHEAEIELTQNALAMLEHRRTDVMRDPDGLTSHAAIELAAVVETP